MATDTAAVATVANPNPYKPHLDNIFRDSCYAGPTRLGESEIDLQTSHEPIRTPLHAAFCVWTTTGAPAYSTFKDCNGRDQIEFKGHMHGTCHRCEARCGSYRLYPIVRKNWQADQKASGLRHMEYQEKVMPYPCDSQNGTGFPFSKVSLKLKGSKPKPDYELEEHPNIFYQTVHELNQECDSYYAAADDACHHSRKVEDYAKGRNEAFNKFYSKHQSMERQLNDMTSRQRNQLLVARELEGELNLAVEVAGGAMGYRKKRRLHDRVSKLGEMLFEHSESLPNGAYVDIMNQIKSVIDVYGNPDNEESGEYVDDGLPPAQRARIQARYTEGYNPNPLIGSD